MNPDAPAHALAHSAPTIARASGVPNIEVAMATDPGRDPNKQVNEDAMLARDTPHGFLAVVCDGMGGHVGGREASHLAIDTIFRVFDATPTTVSPQQILRDALTQANGAVYNRGLQAPELKGMGSTCVAILVHPGGTDVAHVGDSRVYLLTQGQVYQVTKDHSLVQRLIDANMLTPEQAANHPNANQITNAFGQRPDIEVEIRPQAFPHAAGDTFVLCSDGLSDEVGPQDILQILAPYGSLDLSARQLIDLANARGGHDNITVVLVRFPGGTPFAVAPSAGPSSTPTVSGAGVSTTTAEMEIVQPAQIAAAASSAGVVGPASTPASAPPQFSPPPAYAPTPADVPVQKKSNAGKVIAIVVLLIVLALGGAVAMMFVRGDAPPPPATSASADDDDVAPPPSTVKSAVKPKPLPGPEEPAPSTSDSHPRPDKSAMPTVNIIPLPKTAAPPSDTIKTPSGDSTQKIPQ